MLYSSKYWNPEKLKSDFFYKYGNYDLGFKIGADYELISRLFLKTK
jgi:hypothetical protein